MLYTERAHFYHRFRIRGVRDVVFYAIPEHEAFYPEILSMVETGPTGHGTVQALFSAWDALALRRLVGVRLAAACYGALCMGGVTWGWRTLGSQGLCPEGL